MKNIYSAFFINIRKGGVKLPHLRFTGGFAMKKLLAYLLMGSVIKVTRIQEPQGLVSPKPLCKSCS